MTDPETELREQLSEVFSNADYPVNDAMELIPALPDGPSTTFRAGDNSFTAMEMATRVSEHQDFPYGSADALVDDVVAALKTEDMI